MKDLVKNCLRSRDRPMDYRVGIKLFPISSLPVCTTTNYGSVGSGSNKLFRILHKVTDCRLDQPTTPCWTTIAQTSSTVHHVGKSSNFVENSFAAQMVCE